MCSNSTALGDKYTKKREKIIIIRNKKDVRTQSHVDEYLIHKKMTEIYVNNYICKEKFEGVVEWHDK